MKPNVILIVLDTARADSIGASVGGRPLTPALDNLGASGLVFREAISTSCWTLPSHFSIFTGLYGREHGVMTERARLSSEIRTLPEILSDAGYRTAAFSSNVLVSRRFGFERGFGRFEEMFRRGKSRRGLSKRLALLRRMLGFIDDGAHQVNQLAAEWASSVEEPFLLFLNYMEAHQPLFPPARIAEALGWKLPSLLTLHRLRKIFDRKELLFAGKLHVADEDFETMRRLQQCETAYLDEKVGELLGRLEDRLDRTLVVVCSDHGELFGEVVWRQARLIDHHYSLSDPLVRVPLIVKLPGREQGRTVDGEVQLHDIYATVLDICGIGGERRSSRSLLDGTREWAFAEYETSPHQLERFGKRLAGFDVRPFDLALAMLRGGGRKIVRRSSPLGTEYELYDLKSDPLERRNLAANSALLEEMRQRLERWEAGLRKAPAAGEAAEADEETRARLEGLGYM